MKRVRIAGAFHKANPVCLLDHRRRPWRHRQGFVGRLTPSETLVDEASVDVAGPSVPPAGAPPRRRSRRLTEHSQDSVYISGGVQNPVVATLGRGRRKLSITLLAGVGAELLHSPQTTR
jgi:hypothetical protein